MGYVGTVKSIILNRKKTSANDTGDHIANFEEFFMISAFFIAYILFYSITVPCMMHFMIKSWNVTGGLAKRLR